MSKIWAVAVKDLTSSFRSVFAIVFMFGVPLLVAALFILMFGGALNEDEGFSIPRTSVAVVNQDQGSASVFEAFGYTPGEDRPQSIGDLLYNTLSQPELRDLIELLPVDSPQAARLLVDDQKAALALIFPANLSQGLMDSEGTTEIEVYQDPTLTIGPAIVRSITSQILDGFSGARIAANAAVQQLATGGLTPPETVLGNVMAQYLAVTAQANDPNTLVHLVSTEPPDQGALMKNIIATIFTGMIVMYSFYTGTAAAQSILREDETQTLPRLFTTPTAPAHILAGKYLSVLITVVIQALVMLIVGRYLFGIHWGQFSSLSLLTLCMVICASAFGIFVNSIMRNTKQGGVLFGGVVTSTGMLGMIRVFTLGVTNTSPALRTVSLLVPQGWVVDSFLGVMDGMSITSLAPAALIIILWSTAFFSLGVWRFQKRYL